MSSKRTRVSMAVVPGGFQEFLRTETAAGAVLLTCACLALVAANSPLSQGYHALLTTPLGVPGADGTLSMTLQQWINDGLMCVFFLVVGLEIKRELLTGELASRRQAALPIAGAVGGMLVPALMFASVSAGTSAAHGWAIPMATDIAFALGALSLAAPLAPAGLKVFLAALAIVDDLGAVLVIALFYRSDVVAANLALAAVPLVMLVLLNVLGIRRLAPYLLLGVALWFFVHASGLHATIAGVLLALTIPADRGIRAPRGDTSGATDPLSRLEQGLHGFSSFVVMPLFALANAGVSLESGSMGRVTIGVILGLTVGKPLGVTLAALVAVRLGWAVLPVGVTWTALHGCTWLCGIGFTMSLFIATLAFDGGALLDAAKIGILGGSILAGLLGTIVLRREMRSRSV